MAKLAKYELLAKIASGGMAEIYVARTRDGGRERVCVVKRLLPQHAANEDFIQMFLDEGRIAAMFDHPNIVRMHDFGTEDGSHYLAMEYLHGEDLRTVLRTLRGQGKTMPLAQALAVVSSVCAGLHHAHEMRSAAGEALEIVHRDVSPHNVFVTFEGSVKVVDFGIAKSVDRNWETKHGTLKGKVPYMAPEQIKGRKLDRRADIYAVGVMLYELVLGRRPYVLATGGDFAMMMAIARHDIRAPSTVDPAIAPRLEQIILGAIAYDAKQRYATALALQADLDAFARSAALDTSPAALATFLGGLFESRYGEWRAAQRAERDLAAHAVNVEEARAQSGMHDEDVEDATEIDVVEGSSTTGRALSVMPPGSAASLVASTSAAVASVVELFGVTVVTLQGRIDESFDGKALGGSLSGTVLFDMAGVERITSFGVREWLEMMNALDEAEDVEAYLSRCAEPVVTQLSLIRTFAGRSTVVSFDVPFLCDDCGNTFVRTLDCTHDAAAIIGRAVPASACPRCNGKAELDDDPAYLAFATPFADKVVPERIRFVVQRLEETARGAVDAVDKIITPSETRVRVHRDVDPAFRWNRVLDGIEGVVVIEFRGAPRFARESAGRFARAVGALGSEVTSCELVECPVEVAAALGGLTAKGRVRVGSVAFEGRCASCAAARAGAVNLRTMEDCYRTGGALFVPCRRCNGALELGETTDIGAMMNALFGTPSPELDGAPASSRSPVIIAANIDAAAPAVQPSPVASPPVADVTPTHARVAPRWRAALLAGAVVTCLGIAAIVVVSQAKSPGAPSPAANAAPDLGTTPTSANVTDGVDRRADGVYATATTRAPDEDRALATARGMAISRMLAALERDLDKEVLAANEAIGARADDEAAAARFVAQVGAFASPDRIDVKRRADGGTVVLTATYRIAASAWARAAAHYSTTRSAGGVTFAVAFPTHGAGLVAVACDPSVAAGMQVGTLVSEIDHRPVGLLDALSQVGHGRHVVAGTLHGDRVEAKLNVK